MSAINAESLVQIRELPARVLHARSAVTTYRESARLPDQDITLDGTRGIDGFTFLGNNVLTIRLGGIDRYTFTGAYVDTPSGASRDSGITANTRNIFVVNGGRIVRYRTDFSVENIRFNSERNGAANPPLAADSAGVYYRLGSRLVRQTNVLQTPTTILRSFTGAAVAVTPAGTVYWVAANGGPVNVVGASSPFSLEPRGTVVGMAIRNNVLYVRHENDRTLYAYAILPSDFTREAGHSEAFVVNENIYRIRAIRRILRARTVLRVVDGARAFKLLEAADALRVADAAAKRATRVLRSGLRIRDLMTYRPTRPAASDVAVGEEVVTTQTVAPQDRIDLIEYTVFSQRTRLEAADTVRVDDRLDVSEARVFVASLLDQIRLDDAVARELPERAATDLEVADTVERVRRFVRQYGDGIRLTEAVTRLAEFIQEHSEAVRIVDDLQVFLNRVKDVADDVVVVEDVRRDAGRAARTTHRITDVVRTGVNRVVSLADPVSLRERVRTTMRRARDTAEVISPAMSKILLKMRGREDGQHYT